MSNRGPSFARRCWPVLGLSLVVLGVALGLGYYPTRRLGGGEAVRAMLAGCGVAALAGWIGSIPVWTGGLGSLSPASVVNRVLLSTALRLVVALAGALSLALSGWFARVPLLLWMGIAYLLTLLADTVYLVGVAKSSPPQEKP